MTLATLAASAGIRALGSTLLHFLWQGCLIAAVLALVLAILPRALARARYAACCIALALMLLAPAATLLQRWAASSAVAPPRAAAGLGEVTAPGGLLLLLTTAWALGSLATSLRLALGIAQLNRLVERCCPAPGDWQQRLAVLAERLGLGRPVRLLVSATADAPLTLGWLRPVIVLPIAALGSLPAAHVEALLLHELAHVRRHDYLVNLIQACAEALLFYHPAVHWVSRRVRLERECCCDDVAASAVGDELEYARALTAMESWRAALPLPALGSNGGSLLERIERLVRRPARRSPARASATIAGALAAASGLALAGAWACATSVGASTPEAERASARLEHAPDARALDVAWFPPELQRWRPILAAAAERHGVDPAVLAIVTLVESLGDPSAHSPSGAVGLMQLMPTTAARIAAVRELDDHSDDRLWDPDYNVDLGAWYLSGQFAEFAPEGATEHGVALAAIAYNAGPGLARACGEGEAELPAETQRYRDLVVGMWRERALPESATFAAWTARLGEPHPN